MAGWWSASGVGYLAQEFAALGVPLDERATRTDEHLAAMRALWTMDAPEFHGRHVDVAGVDAHPRPVQPGGPPIMIGGNSGLARRRAITSARGWIPADFDLDATRAARRALDRDLAELERPASLGPFDFTVISPTNRLDRELVDGYRELGVDRLIVLPGPRRADGASLPRRPDRRHLPDHRPRRRRWLRALSRTRRRFCAAARSMALTRTGSTVTTTRRPLPASIARRSTPPYLAPTRSAKT